MSNFAPKLEEATEKELYHMVSELDFRVVPLASDELTRRTIKELQETIRMFNEQSSKQTKKMITLTQRIVVLTIIMVLGLIIQVILTL